MMVELLFAYHILVKFDDLFWQVAIDKTIQNNTMDKNGVWEQVETRAHHTAMIHYNKIYKFFF